MKALLSACSLTAPTLLAVSPAYACSETLIDRIELTTQESLGTKTL